MPIISAVKNLGLPQDSLFKRPTVFDWSATPEYAFHFLPPQDAAGKTAFDRNFFFDNCEYFGRASHEVSATLPDGNDVDLNDHSVHYLRLYALKYMGRADPKYYLAPWLTIPFDFANGSYSPVVHDPSPTAASDAMITGPVTIAMQVVPTSIYQTRTKSPVAALVKAAYDKAIHDAVAPRTLTLVPSNPAILQAVWSAPSTASAMINEVECALPQQIKISIAASSGEYAYREYVDIMDSDGFHMGRMYLLFLRNTPHHVVFFKAAKKSPTELTITMLDASSTDVVGYVTELNKTFSKAAIPHTAVNPLLSVGGTLCDVSNPIDIVGADASNAAVNFDMLADASNNVLSTVTLNFVEKIALATVREHVFVFFAEWAHQTSQSAGPEQNSIIVTSLEGLSYTGWRVSCIFSNANETLRHEVGHALGLTHYFLEKNHEKAKIQADLDAAAVAMGNAARGAITLASDLNIQTQADFYALHNDMNNGNACIVFQSRPPASADFHRFRFQYQIVNIDRYRVEATLNLMDYRPTAMEGAASNIQKDKLVKHQIEVLRYIVGNQIYKINAE